MRRGVKGERLLSSSEMRVLYEDASWRRHRRQTHSPPPSMGGYDHQYPMSPIHRRACENL